MKIGKKMISFKHLRKNDINDIAHQLFLILAENMSQIAPTGNSFEEDEKIWSSNVIPALEKDKRKIVLFYDDAEIIGFFQYYINNSLFMMDEIQIKKEYQGKQVFRGLYGYLISVLPKEIETVEAFSNKKITKHSEAFGIN